MNKLLNSLFVRVLAFVLLLASLAAFVLCGLAVIAISNNNGYRLGEEGTLGGVFYGWCYSQTENALAKFGIDKSTSGLISDSAFAFIIKDKNGEEVYNSLNGRETLLAIYPQSMEFIEEHPYSDNAAYEDDIERGVIVYRGEEGYGYTWASRTRDASEAAAGEAEADAEADAEAGAAPAEGEDAAAPADSGEGTDGGTKKTAAEADGEEEEAAAEGADSARAYAEYDSARAPYTIYGFILADIPADSALYAPMQLMQGIWAQRNPILAALVVSGMLSVALFALLMASAGRRAPTGAVTPSWVERIPFDLYSGVMLLLGVCICAVIDSVELDWALDLSVITFVGAAGVLLIAVMLLWCMSFSVRIKLKCVIRSCICYKLIAWCWRIVRAILKWCAELMRALAADVQGIPFMPRVLVALALVLIIEFIYICTGGDSVGWQLFGWFVERVLLVLAAIYLLSVLRRLLDAGEEIANGNTACRVDTARMRGALKAHGENLNRITEGIDKAVAQQVKSERLKTELITNVSHDIKTPLTSIINYVDLIEKEEPENERLREYVGVLARQSARLKKLIEDLMEASKAATGNLAVKPERCELGVLVVQTAGEYAEKLEQAQLNLVVSNPDTPVFIMADRQHLWRIFDNLMNNICKYSQPGTRVYIDVKKSRPTEGGAPCAEITFRNISKARLDVSEDELTERFVRGDSSRNTEGSGLGLSIAGSLTRLQKGEMTLTVDGDLFKVCLRFPAEE